MKSKGFLIAATVGITLLVHPSKTFAQDSKSIEYSCYDIAGQFERQGVYVSAYRYLILFQYINKAAINQPANKTIKAKLEKEIAQIEEFLGNTSSLSYHLNVKGFTEIKLDSVFNKYQMKIAADHQIDH